MTSLLRLFRLRRPNPERRNDGVRRNDGARRRWPRRAALGATLAVALATTGLVAMRAEAQGGAEHVVNGGFDSGTGPWWSTGNVTMGVVGGQLCAQIPAKNPAGANPWDAIIGQNDIALAAGASYTFSFKATASTDVVIRALVGQQNAPFGTFLAENPTVTGTQGTFTFFYTQGPAETGGQVAFQVGNASATPWQLCLDDVSLTSSAEHVINGGFDNGTANWFGTPNITMSVSDGKLCAQIPAKNPAGANPWDAIIGQNDIALTAGDALTFSFTADASTPVVIRALVGQQNAPFGTFLAENPTVISTPQTFSFSFPQPADETGGQVAFQVGNASATPWTLCLDNVSLAGGSAPPVYTPDTGPRVRVNQVAYLPNGPKQATLVTDATTALSWELRNAANAVVASGLTTPRGMDATSGQNVQTIDFSGYSVAGTGYTLSADGQTSHPFDLDTAAYEKLRLDALKFYYTQRSGVPILDSLRPGYGRPAGHVGVAPNQGDISVPCQPGVCDYTLNVSGGWYDAGDHGKYVVNGGISVYQLMSEFERTKNAATAKPAKLGDSTLALPESGNGVPDILDEARFELQFLLSMQVPAGKPLAGMAHHKIHDENWTGLPLLPNLDPQKRELHPPSTAATLNLAAAAAQCARLFAPYDHAFANRCLTAARTAWAAAVANPAIYATPADGNGGGSYDDNYVLDEFYWAAAELYITTGEKAFSDYILASPLNSDDEFRADGFDWKWTGAVGRLELATVPNNLPGRAALRASVLSGAQKYLDAQAANPYGLPYAPSSGGFDWGSNNLILNNMVVLASAFDISGDRRYRDAVLNGLNYILGRNALNQSYVTGYGEHASENEHSRWYTHQLDPTMPHPPVGSLSGGPNSSIQDPKAQAKLQGCAPQFCYLDDIESWSTNELTINWNSPLSWISAFVADQGTGVAPPPATCAVSYSKASALGFFVATVTITNNSASAVNGWTLSWAFTGDQRVLVPVGANASQSGATVNATNIAVNKQIKPHKSVSFAFLGSTVLANPTPGLFSVNGKACG